MDNIQQNTQQQNTNQLSAGHQEFNPADASQRFAATDERGRAKTWKVAQSAAEFIDHMNSGSAIGRMLGGDTGIGKSSFMKTLSKLLGMPIILVEVPHLIEEEIINIPFIVFRDGQKFTGQASEPISDQAAAKYASVTLAPSRLVTKLKSITPLSDAEHMRSINSDATLSELYKQVEHINPGGIQSARQYYSKMLFLDEYLRSVAAPIRNMLRGVLNRNIGTDKLADDVYVVYASNLFDNERSAMDSSVSDHATFLLSNHSAPSVKEWLHYMTSSNDITVRIKNDVVDAFEKYLSDDVLSLTDSSSRVRSSPRRWSDILLYINAMYPFKSPKDIAVMYTTLSRQLKNAEGVASKNALTTLNSIITSLGASSGFDNTTLRTTKNTEWRAQVSQSIYAVVASKGNKKYVPIVQGPPGIGKTAIGKIFEEDYNMRFIPISCDTLSVDQISGIPLPDKKKNDAGEATMDVDFAAPQLYTMIINKMHEHVDAYKKYLGNLQKAGKIPSAAAAFKEFETQQYQFAVFFDEFNRVKDIAVFNSLRRLILNKEFNDAYTLPDNVFVIGAMNPNDKGTMKLTSHMLDAVDLIDAEPSWKDTKGFISKEVPARIQEFRPHITNEAISAAVDSVTQIAEHFKSIQKGRPVDDEFFIKIGISELYVSPRDYDNLTRSLSATYQSVFNRYDNGSLEADEVKPALAERGAKTVMEALNWRAYANGMTQTAGVQEAIENFLESILNFNLKKEIKQESLSDVLMSAYNGELDLSQDSDFYNFFNSSEIDRHALDKELYGAFKHIFESQIDNITSPGVLKTITGDRNTEKSIANLVNKILEAVDAFGLTPPDDILMDASLYILDLIAKKTDELKATTQQQITIAKMILRSYKDLKDLLL